MKFSLNHKDTITAGVFLFSAIMFAVEVFFYPNLDTVLSLQGYETGLVVSGLFCLNYLLKAVNIEEDS